MGYTMKNCNRTNNKAIFALSAISLALSGMTAKVHAQDEEEAEKIDKIVTIGTRVNNRTATDVMAPVDILTNQQLMNTGATEVGKALQMAAPSFNFSATTVSDGTDIIRPATLRGLGPDQVLVLVNGKRRHQQALVNVQETIGKGSAGYDINAIPLSAVERIEILRDGAAAQYGSDAIAGVINVILKSQADYTTIRTEFGQTYEGDGENFVIGVNTGFAGDWGYVNITGELRDRGATNRAGVATLESTNGGLIGDWYDNGQPTTRLKIGDAESSNQYLWVNAGFDVGETSEFYAFGGLSTRSGESSGFYRGVGSNRVVPEYYPEGFLPTLLTDVEDKSIVFGVKGDINDDWTYDVSYATGDSEFKFGSKNSVNTSWYYEPVDPNDSSQGIIGESPTSAHDGTLIFSQDTFNVDIAGSVDFDWHSPLYIGFGLEQRTDSYQIKRGDLWSYAYGRNDDPSIDIVNTDNGGSAPPGIQGFPGFKPSTEVDAARDNTGVYLDMETDISDQTTVGAAIRFEDYDVAGSNFSGKLSTRHEVNDSFSVRSTFATGFRAPGVQQMHYSQVLTNIVNGNLVETGTIANSSSTAAAFGISQLEEETSTSFSLGLVMKPSDEWTITADYYTIDIEDRIVMSEAITGISPEVQTLLDANQLGAAQFFTNAVDTKTTGLDLISTYNMPLGDDSLNLQAAMSWVKTEVKNINSVSSLIPADVLFSDTQVLRLERGQPKTTGTLSGEYEAGPFSANLAFNYFGSVEGQAFTGVRKKWSGKWITDVSFKYEFTSDLSVQVGANNLFDVYPDKWGEAGSVFAEAGFTYGWETMPFGINGGYYFGRVDYRF
jgi:iron complex outermembrane recepter protein